MASFTDAIPQFNPYIQQLPVEAMVSVGMEKQQRYDQGIQRIQSQIDQVAGLDIYRSTDKQLLQSKLNDLGSKLKTVAAADFSNYQLVNSVAGMASTIVKDPVILAAVQSTQNIKNNQKVIEEAREKGELTPDNEDFYNKQLASYENAGLVNDKGRPVTFNAKYIPHFNVFKFAKETFDAVKPDGMTWDQVYETDTDGNPKINPSTGQPIYSPTMIRMEKEGVFPKKVRETLDQIFSDPRVSRQLQITGEYNYKGFSPDMLKQRISNQESTIMAAQNSQIAQLTLMKTSAKTQEEKDQIDVQIGNIQNSINTAREQYTKLKETADANPDVIRGFLHEDDVRNRYTTMFGYTKTKQTTESNPGWEANYKLEQAAWDRTKFYTDLSYKKERDRIEDLQFERKLAQDAVIAGGGEWELSDMPGNFDKVALFDRQYNAASEDFVNSSSEFIWDATYSKIPGNDARFQRLLDAGNSRSKAIDIILAQDAEKQGLNEVEFRTKWGGIATTQINSKGGDVPEDLLTSFSMYNTAKKSLEDLDSIKNKIDSVTSSQTDQTILDILSGDKIKPQTIKFRGQDVQLSKQDIVDLGVYLRGYKHIFGFNIDDGARQSAKSAEDRLRRQGKGDILDFMMRTRGAQYDPVTRVARVIGSPLESIVDIYSGLTGGTGEFDFGQINKVYESINNDQFSKALSTKSQVLDQYFTVSPNLKQSLFTGNAEADRNRLINVKRLAGAYTSAGQNLSGTFSDFSEAVASVTDPKDLNLEIKSYPTVGGGAEFQIVAYKDGNEYSMTIQPDEAARFGLANPYISNPIAILENRINSAGGKTSYGNPDDKNTYINGDAYLQKSRGDFPALINSPYNVMANMTNVGGLYFGKIFVQDPTTGRSSNVFTTPGSDIETVYNSLRSLNNTFVRSLIPNK
jgi:hypothetical protein